MEYHFVKKRPRHMESTMPLDHHVYHLPKTELFSWLCMYIDIFVLISVVCLNKNMYIFRVLGYIKNNNM